MRRTLPRRPCLHRPGRQEPAHGKAELTLPDARWLVQWSTDTGRPGQGRRQPASVTLSRIALPGSTTKLACPASPTHALFPPKTPKPHDARPHARACAWGHSSGSVRSIRQGIGGHVYPHSNQAKPQPNPMTRELCRVPPQGRLRGLVCFLSSSPGSLRTDVEPVSQSVHTKMQRPPSR